MYRLAITLIVGLWGISPGLAGNPAKGKIVLDLWDAAYLQNGKAGYVHTFTEEIQMGGETLLRTTIELRLTVKRNTEVVQLNMDNGTVENLEGKVVGVFMKQFLGKNKTLELTGTVTAGSLHTVVDGTKTSKPQPWDPRVVGLFRQQKMFKEKQIKTGDELNYLSYEPSINAAVPTFVRVKGYEDVELFGGQQKKRLLRVETRTAKIDKVQMPPLTSWVGDNKTVQRSQVDVPGLGIVVLYRTSKAVATAPGSLDTLTDIGLTQAVPLKAPIFDAYATSAAVYRITVRGDDDPGSTFSRDARQQIKNLRGNTFELHVRAAGSEPAEDKQPGVEFTQSSYFINCDDALVKKHALAAVGNEKESWKKALLIEKWVYGKMESKNHETLATADHVARTLEGDCTEYAMLTAAMCRAQGIPSRTAVGLIYADVKGKAAFAFHMWTEVFVGGRWTPLDATLGLGKVGATHLKIADQSWHEVRTMVPLFPVMRVMGRVSIDVVSVENSVKR
jgi:transglutaminase-like putative cysteine protease